MILAFSPLYVTVNISELKFESEFGGNESLRLEKDFIAFLRVYFMQIYGAKSKVVFYEDELSEDILSKVSEQSEHKIFYLKLNKLDCGGYFCELVLDGKHFDFVEIYAVCKNGEIMLDATRF